MDNSPLNEAHFHHRRAEANSKTGQFDEAIECHKKAIAYLQDAVKLTTSIKAKESLELQCDYHRKQIDISLYKKNQLELHKKNLGKQKLKMAKTYVDFNRESNGSDNLEAAIHKTMDEADSIVEFLFKRNHINTETENIDYDSIDKHVVHCHNINENLIVSGVKEPKKDNVVIEELQTVNQQLRKLVNQLLTQLDASSLEIKTLRSKVSYLEKERNRLLGLQSVSPGPQGTSNNDSIENSGFVFSPCTELSMTAVVDELPPLPPLEMPEFDFESLISQAKTGLNIDESLQESVQY